jgi:hypothetical protein
MNFKSQLIVAAALIGIGAPAFAQNLIDHNKALAGNVTPGDTAGYPITLSQSGHYVLKSNLVTNQAGSDGAIVVTAPNVTIDLNGFTINGSYICTRNDTNYTVTCPNSSNNFTGINGQARNLVVRNGSVVGFVEGIILADGGRIEDVALNDNVDAVWAGGGKTAVRIVGSSFSRNFRGIFSGGKGTVVSRTVFLNNGAAVHQNGNGNLMTISDSFIGGSAVSVSLGAYALRGVYMTDNKSSNGTVTSY